jgi:hypothetical protein
MPVGIRVHTVEAIGRVVKLVGRQVAVAVHLDVDAGVA